MPKADNWKSENSPSEYSEDSRAGNWQSSKVGLSLSGIFLFVLFALCWYWGWQIAACALADPDTCWLLAVGKLILAKGIPGSDPFSWTAKTYAGPYIPYQWLASVSFYTLYSCFGAKSLLFFVSLIVLLSFFVLPLMAARSFGVSLLWQTILSILAISAGSFHFPLRPELFSYFLLSVLSIILTRAAFINGETSKTPLVRAAQDLSEKTVGPAVALVSGLLLFCCGQMCIQDLFSVWQF